MDPNSMDLTETNTPAVLTTSETALLKRFAAWVCRSWGAENEAFLQTLFTKAQLVRDATANCHQGNQSQDDLYPFDEWCENHKDECFFFHEFDEQASYLKQIAYEMYQLTIDPLTMRDAEFIFNSMQPVSFHQTVQIEE